MARKKPHPEINDFSIIYYLRIVGRLHPAWAWGLAEHFADQLGDNTICHPNQRERDCQIIAPGPKNKLTLFQENWNV